MRRTAVLDIGGTRIKAGLFEDDRLVMTKEADTLAKKGAPSVMNRCMKLLSSFEPFDAIGISTCGQVDEDTGSIHYANDNMPGYTGTPVRKLFEERFHVPCAVENDVYAAARGEAAYGAGRNHTDFICLTYGTGIGGGVFLNGSPYYGTGRNAGVMIGGLYSHSESAAGWQGTYESCASTTALVRSAALINPDIHNGRDLFAQLEDERISQVLDHWMQECAAGIASLIHVYNIPAVILGGGIMDQELVFNGIRNKAFKILIPGFEGTEILKAQLGNLAGLYGVKAMADQL